MFFIIKFPLFPRQSFSTFGDFSQIDTLFPITVFGKLKKEGGVLVYLIKITLKKHLKCFSGNIQCINRYLEISIHDFYTTFSKDFYINDFF